MKKVAVVGAGAWGRNLVRVYQELGALSMICDPNMAVLQECRQLYPRVSATADYAEVLERKDIEAVVLAVPAAMHFGLAREALLAGRDVFVEKPLSLDVSEAEELCRLAAAGQRILMVGHLLRYHPAFERLYALVQNGELGRLQYIYSNRLSFGKIRREEDILWSFAPHDLSMILALTGEQPETVMATGGTYLHRRIADVTTTHLEFASGIRAHVFVSWLHPFKEQVLVAVGDKNMAVFNDTRPWPEKLLLYPHDIRWRGGVPVPDRREAVRVEVEEHEPLGRECRHFLDCLTTRETPRTDSREGLAVLRVLKAAQDSVSRGGVPVRPVAVAPLHQVHETAWVDEDVEVGPGTKIWHFCHVMRGARIGKDCTLGQNVLVGPEVIIGDGCRIQNNVSVYRGVTLEDEVFCGPSMVFTNVYNPRAHVSRMDELRPTLVKRGATIGANATIVCGHAIGRYAFVGAGAVVTRGAPDHALMVGNPARQIGWMCACGNRLDDELRCSHCGATFSRHADGVVQESQNIF